MLATTAVLWQLYMADFLKLSLACIFLYSLPHTVITVYKHDQQKTIVY